MDFKAVTKVAALMCTVGITAIPAVKGREQATQQEAVTTKIVYVVGTTTTEPPHVWLVNGTSSVDVLLIQQALVALGYKVAIDGVYGTQTEEAVRAFQADHHLWVDGIVGPVTARALGLTGILGHTDDPPPVPPTTWVEIGNG